MTSAENTSENRIDAIERLLAVTAANLQTVSANLQTVSASLQTVAANQIVFEARMTRFEQNMERFEQNTNASIVDLSHHVAQLVESSDRQQIRFDQMLEQAERDRVTFQAEIQRIWNYLTGQQRNGHEPPNTD